MGQRYDYFLNLPNNSAEKSFLDMEAVKALAYLNYIC